jgi:hypothetical protein
MTLEHYWGIGDPQTTFARFMAVLEHRGLLGPDARLRPDVALLSVGDHFDFPPGNMPLAEASAQGVAILEWLAEHPEAQAPILMGNHDVCRVMELHRMSDADFAAARALAEHADEETFAQRFPDLPTRGIARRDFSGFTAAQRTCVQSMLLRGRMKLAEAVRLHDGRAALVTHAGVTQWVLDALGAPETRDPVYIAQLLNDLLAQRVADVAEDWRAGRPRPLDLSPSHAAGVTGAEGGGLLYHRLTSQLDAWSRQGAAPRRFLPGDVPRGLLQAVGHTQHKKTQELLPHETDAVKVAPGELRHLVFEDDRVLYRSGIDSQGADTVMWLFDAGLHFAPTASVRLMPFASWLRPST